MRARYAMILPVFGLAACAEFPQHEYKAMRTDTAAVAAAAATDGAVVVAPDARPVVAPVLTAAAAPGRLPMARPAAARAEAYNRTSADEKAAAAAPTAGGERKLGSTVASLGNPTEQGFWIKTPLVKAPGKGRLVDPASGKSVNVDLIPLAGPESGGSQVSLPALQMLGVPLTALPRLDVFAL